MRARMDAGRYTIVPFMLVAAIPYAIAVSLYLVNVDDPLRLKQVVWEIVIGKAFLAVVGPASLFGVWLRFRPPRRIRWAYDWMGGWMVAGSIGWLGGIGRDLLDPYRIDLTGRIILGYGAGFWVLVGTGLLVYGAVHLTGLIQEERTERQRLEALMRFTHRITNLDFQAILDETVRELYWLLRADACVLFLWSEQEQVLTPVAGQYDPDMYSDDYVARMMAFKCPPGYGLTGTVMVTGEPTICHDVSRDPRTRAVSGYENIDKSSVLAPLILEGRKLGVVRLTRQGLQQFMQDDLNLVMSFAGQAALIIEHGRVLKELSELSITDSLTGLFNARQFHRVLEREVPLAFRHGYPLSLLMMDSDSLKQVNDLMGHQTGDHYLKEIGRVIRETIRKTDFAFRYAGDEFLVLLPMAPAEMAVEVAERIRATVEAIHVAEEVPCTISIGVATLPLHAVDTEGLLAAADEAMYRSKRSGKNRTSLSQRSPVNVSN